MCYCLTNECYTQDQCNHEIQPIKINPNDDIAGSINHKSESAIINNGNDDNLYLNG